MSPERVVFDTNVLICGIPPNFGAAPRRLPGFRFSPPCSRHLADTGISADDEFAGAQRGLLKIGRINRKDLPAGYLFPQYLN